MKLSVTEKREQFFILLGLFFIALIALGSVIFYTDNEHFMISKSNLELRIAEDNKFEEVSANALLFVDSVSRQIKRFDPVVQAVFLETDIKKTVNDLNALYVVNDFDNRYIIFGQGALLYDNFFVDRRELKGNLNDIERIQKSLDNCLVNRKQLETVLQMQGVR